MNYLQNTLNSLSSSLGDYLPNTIAAILILIIGSLIAGFIKRLITKLIKRTKIDDRLSSDKMKLSSFIGKLVYFLAMIFVFMLALEKLGMTNVLDPVKNLLNNFLAFVPNIVGAGLVGYIGYMLATIVSELVGLSGDTIQNFVPKLRLPNNLNLVGILKKLVFIFIFIPMLITALNILNMDTISEPATVMLEQFFAAIPRILVAVIILIFFVVGGRFVSQLLSDLLENLKINELLSSMNLEGITAKTNIPKLVGNLAFFFIVLFGLMTAIEKLEFIKLTEILNNIAGVAGNILFGMIILIIGNWISGIAYKSLSKSNNNQFVASILRICVLAIFLAMGLKTMGIGDEIINMAFGITLATVAITIALSFGLGGRAAAGKQMERILDKFNQKK
ncbi:mechanosensitive ion channel [Maribacter sp. TH_r10]|uniref:Mechanosensitive ion channel n=1 Tax=Maribacter luteus TaxID=2594478 RepID=A0A6I2MPE1_9FLAO|nr:MULTISPECIES: mechanosensitive ion channel [Maribacter]MDV7140710.1 mechanosensitive ion channel [Maribacter sp. TH_r10]MRX65703.1 mechanosensitive ion channel [Maribacter luteus]|tara:strand:- start:354 stop:1526 length:1173 start_codon:yes stop_codon:yes gene_type:complete